MESMTRLQLFKVWFWSNVAGGLAFLFSMFFLNNTTFQDHGCFITTFLAVFLVYGHWMELNNQKKRGRVNGN